MKKKRQIYVLLALVAVIWGVLGFRIVSSIKPAQPEKTQDLLAYKFTPGITHQRDTFSIAANYRDPFLGTLPKGKKPKKTKLIASNKDPIPERNIVYSGMLKDKNSGAKIFFVHIDGQQQLMAINDVYEKVKLVSGNAKKIKVRYNNRSKVIPLTE